MSEFYFSWLGNKRKEIDKILNVCKDFENIKTIVEPFGGTCFFSYFLYKNYENNNFNFIINDIDEQLTFFCNNFYKNKEEYIKKSLDLINDIDDKEKYNNLINEYKNKKITDEDFIEYYYVYNTYYAIRKGFFPTTRNKPKYKYILDKTKKYDDFFKNNTYLNFNFIDIIEKYKDDETALIYFDPPYVQTDTSSYFNQIIDWEYLINFLETCKCKYILHVNCNIWMKFIFTRICKKFINYDYNYQNLYIKRRDTKTIHSIYTNIL